MGIKFRTKSAMFSVRYNQQKRVSYLYLESPWPKPGDIEWGLRIAIDKYLYLSQNETVNDGGAGSNGLCIAVGNLTNRDYQCGGCPVKELTGKPNCVDTPLQRLFWPESYSQRKEIYQELGEFFAKIYKDKFGDYVPEIWDDKPI